MVNPEAKISPNLIEDFCKRWGIIEFSLFGSTLRDDFNPSSDLDIMVAFSPKVKWGLFDHVKMEQELAEVFNRKIDLFTKESIEHTHNWMLRREILGTAEVIYETR
jgi:Predicted nucleotidyltransferases